MVTAALTGALDIVKYRHDDLFNLDIPTECPDVPPEILDPKNTWIDKDSYDLSAKKLAQMFIDNFKKFENVSPDIIACRTSSSIVLLHRKIPTSPTIARTIPTIIKEVVQANLNEIKYWLNHLEVF